ncbi:caspase activity and apoptosis inhibitor 1 isoform X2 [Carcharodon carcharias]|uniref:caspase activity and apoptosis inhibitor 1 isoform X2 n=1 Tax=Carcharodon carcharias TaxID=13397 RepID=UPI001B7EE497|nr:caspase activity and apoptosis inhibitor 1 isoform X2 [Carcharodon carcharias]
MAGKKSSKDKKRKRSHGEESHSERKWLNSDSGTNESGRLASEKEMTNEASDLEEGGLDLNVALKPISSYISDRKEMLEQCFRVIGERKLQKMLPDILKNCSVEEIKALCLEQLTLLSDKKLLQIIEGDDLGSSDTEEEVGENDKYKKKLEAESQQDNNIDSTSSYKECNEQEAPDLKQGGASGDESDALSINAETYDSDIEQNGNDQEDSTNLVPHKSTATRTGVEDEIQKDIERSVNEILGLSGSTTGRHQSAGSPNPDGDGLHPSAQQLELLELEMRARAIKALMRAGDTKTQS